MQTSPLPVKGCKLLTYARHSWPLSSEGALTCHTHCDTGLPFIMVFSEDPLHSHLLLNVWQWNSHYLFLRLRSVATGDRTPMSRMRGEHSTSMPPRRFKPVLNNQLNCLYNHNFDQVSDMVHLASYWYSFEHIFVFNIYRINTNGHVALRN